MAGEYQFSLIDVTKQQGVKTILKDVNLSFFYGAHIGVIGANGAGKSSLLKILAGIDTDILGTCQVAKGTKVGYLPQEPELDDSKTVAEVVEEGVADAKAMVERYEDLCMELDDPRPWRRWRSSRRSSTRRTTGTSTTSWRGRWRPCTVRPATRRCLCSPAARGAAWR